MTLPRFAPKSKEYGFAARSQGLEVIGIFNSTRISNLTPTQRNQAAACQITLWGEEAHRYATLLVGLEDEWWDARNSLSDLENAFFEEEVLEKGENIYDQFQQNQEDWRKWRDANSQA